MNIYTAVTLCCFISLMFKEFSKNVFYNERMSTQQEAQLVIYLSIKSKKR